MNSKLINQLKGISSIRWATFAVFLLSAGLIIAAARGDLWLDEIWSLGHAGDAEAVSEVFTSIHHDNNHPLNTAYLYCLGPDRPLYSYRLMSALSGILSIFLVGYIAKREWGWQEAFWSMLLAGTSYPLILYFSEARGYALAIFLSLASYALLREDMRKPSLIRVLWFWTTSVLGILAHSTFIMASGAFVVASIADEKGSSEPLAKRIFRLILTHALPLVFIGCWYAYFIRHMKIAGGPVYSLWRVISTASAYVLGLPMASIFMTLAVLCLLLAVVLGVYALRREKNNQWVFYLSVIALMPALVLIVTQPEFLYFRYFMIGFPFFYLLLAHLGCKAYRAFSPKGKTLLLALLLIVLWGQSVRVRALLTYGRGDYSAAL